MTALRTIGIEEMMTAGILGIAFPEGQLFVGDDFESVQFFQHELATCRSAITTQDMAGLVVLRLCFYAMPPGRLTPGKYQAAALLALARLNRVAPHLIEESRFFPKIICRTHPNYASAVADVALRRWRNWLLRLSPDSPGADQRQVIARGIARLRCYPELQGEGEAARRAKVLVDAYFRRRGWAGSNLEPEDILNEAYAVPRLALAKTGILRVTPEGSFTYDPEALRDLVRRDSFGRHSDLGADEEAVPCGDDEPPSIAANTEVLARLQASCDDIDRAILDRQCRTDSEAGAATGLSRQAAGRRLQRIRATLTRLSTSSA